MWVVGWVSFLLPGWGGVALRCVVCRWCSVLFCSRGVKQEKWQKKGENESGFRIPDDDEIDYC